MRVSRLLVLTTLFIAASAFAQSPPREKAVPKAAQGKAQPRAPAARALITEPPGTPRDAKPQATAGGLITEPPPAGSEASPQAETPAAIKTEPPAPRSDGVQPPPAAETLITKPAVATSETVIPVAQPRQAPSARSTWLDQFLAISITDILIALFAGILALFTVRLWAVTGGLWESTRRLTEDNRRAVEASERAAEAAMRSADAADKTVSTLRDTAERQLRPYVTVKQFLQGPVKDERQTLHGWVFQVVWQNTGVTPTSGFRYWAVLNQFEPAIPEDFSFAAPPIKDFAGGELGSNGTVTSGTLFIALKEAAQIQARTRKAYIYGEAQYQDLGAKDAKRVTRFCVELVLIAEPTAAQNTPFTFTYHAKHNSVT